MSNKKGKKGKKGKKYIDNLVSDAWDATSKTIQLNAISWGILVVFLSIYFFAIGHYFFLIPIIGISISFLISSIELAGDYDRIFNYYYRDGEPESKYGKITFWSNIATILSFIGCLVYLLITIT